MRIALYPGSFDPITHGHVDIIDRAAKLFDRLIVAVAVNHEKSSTFSPEERVHLIQSSLGSRSNIEVVHFDGLLVDFARRCHVDVVVRGLRAVTDFEYEFQMALMNKSLNPDLETMFLAAREAYTYVSSRVIKEVASLGGDITRFVPEVVAQALKARG
jgi:pantetheine-phosphate adenylyltransferase